MQRDARAHQTNGKHLLGLINDVLDLSKIEAGQLTLSLERLFDQGRGARVSMSRSSRWPASKKLNFKVEVARDLPRAHGDERRLAQVLLNLVGNAIKFTDAGEVAMKATAANGSFTVAVRDTGPGIAEADQAKIFEEFQQAESAQTKDKGGTGLGLAISKRIVEMHGGRLWVEFEPRQWFDILFHAAVARGASGGNDMRNVGWAKARFSSYPRGQNRRRAVPTRIIRDERFCPPYELRPGQS